MTSLSPWQSFTISFFISSPDTRFFIQYDITSSHFLSVFFISVTAGSSPRGIDHGIHIICLIFFVRTPQADNAADTCNVPNEVLSLHAEAPGRMHDTELRTVPLSRLRASPAHEFSRSYSDFKYRHWSCKLQHAVQESASKRLALAHLCFQTCILYSSKLLLFKLHQRPTL